MKNPKNTLGKNTLALLKNTFKFFWKGLIYEAFNYPYRRIIPNALYGKNVGFKSNLRFLIGFIPILRNFYYKIEVSERIVEDPFVISEITRLPLNSRILDFGCFSSVLPLQFSSLGYKVTGVDLNNYSYKHPNFNFLNMDFLDNKFKSNYFDAIYAVSAIEHVGANWYSNENKNNTDTKVVDEFQRILKRGGRLIITAPFGKKAKKLTDSRMYDRKSLEILFNNFTIKSGNYFSKINDTTWVRSDLKNLKSFNVACWVMEK